MPLVLVFRFFFLLELQECSSERDTLDMLPFSGVLVIVPITSFLPSVRGLEFLLFDGCAGALLQLLWQCCVSVHCVGIGFLAPAE